MAVDEIYARWAMRSLALRQDFSQKVRHQLFHRPGVLWMAREADPYSVKSAETLQNLGVPFQKLSWPELEKRYPQIACGPITWGILEPERSANSASAGANPRARSSPSSGSGRAAGEVFRVGLHLCRLLRARHYRRAAKIPGRRISGGVQSGHPASCLGGSDR